MTKRDHSTTPPAANRYDLCAAAEEWRHNLDLTGPFGDDAAFNAVLSQVPDCCADDAEIVRGWLDGRRGYRDASRAHDSHYMSGFWLAVGRNLEERHGPEKPLPSSSAAHLYFHGKP